MQHELHTILFGQDPCLKPSSSQFIHRPMVGSRLGVIPFEVLKLCQNLLNGRRLEGTQSWKQGSFFIGGVKGRGLAKIPKGDVERLPLTLI